jgi:hypothetical protein
VRIEKNKVDDFLEKFSGVNRLGVRVTALRFAREAVEMARKEEKLLVTDKIKSEIVKQLKRLGGYGFRNNAFYQESVVDGNIEALEYLLEYIEKHFLAEREK